MDWAISMGIFILALFFIFLYIKPGFSPLYSSDTLLKVVEEKFKEDAYWTVKKLPVVVGNCKPKDSKEKFKVELNFLNGWRLPNESSKHNLNKEGSYLFFLHNDNSSRKFDVDLIVNPKECEQKVITGTTENLRGISDKKINDLKKEEYNKVRVDWKYPPSKDFSVFLNEEKIVGGENPKGNVLANQYKEFVLTANGTLSEAVVSLRTW